MLITPFLRKGRSSHLLVRSVVRNYKLTPWPLEVNALNSLDLRFCAMAAEKVPLQEEEPKVIQMMSSNERQHVSTWLFVCAGVLFVVTVSWAVSRLTEIGLSILEPKPFKSGLPGTEQEWKKEYENYVNSPEFTKQRSHEGFTLEDFKHIYKWGLLHQQVSGLVVATYFLPWAYFTYQGAIPRGLQPTMLALLGLVGMQAVIVGIMDGQPKKKFEEGSSVRTAYRRYALQLFSTVALYTGTVWVAMTVRHIPMAPVGHQAAEQLRTLTLAMTMLSFFTIVTGSLAAGPDAMLVYKQWPSLEGRLKPLQEYLLLVPGRRKDISDDDAARGYHRMLAFTTVLLVVFLSRQASGLVLPPPVKTALKAVQLAVAFQAAGGIMAVFYGPLVPALSIHQGGSLAVLTTFLWLALTLRIQPMVWL